MIVNSAFIDELFEYWISDACKKSKIWYAVLKKSSLMKENEINLSACWYWMIWNEVENFFFVESNDVCRSKSKTIHWKRWNDDEYNIKRRAAVCLLFDKNTSKQQLFNICCHCLWKQKLNWNTTKFDQQKRNRRLRQLKWQWLSYCLHEELMITCRSINDVRRCYNRCICWCYHFVMNEKKWCFD